MPHPRGRHRPGRPKKPRQKLPHFDGPDLRKITLPRQSRGGGGKTKLTNRRAAQILQAIAHGCYRETAAQLAGITPETLCHWMRWANEPYVTFQRLVQKAEADLEARMVQILTPVALDATLVAAQQLEADHDAALAQWRLAVERARYEAERVERRYRAVESENRLVARGLEAEWERRLTPYSAGTPPKS